MLQGVLADSIHRAINAVKKFSAYRLSDGGVLVGSDTVQYGNHSLLLQDL